MSQHMTVTISGEGYVRDDYFLLLMYITLLRGFGVTIMMTKNTLKHLISYIYIPSIRYIET